MRIDWSRTTAVAVICISAWLVPAASAAAAVAGAWNMDETTGTTAFDTSGNGNNGLLTNVTVGAPGISGAPDDFGYLFDSTSQMVVPKSAGLAAGSQAITITMSVKTTVRPGIGSFDFDMVSKGGYKVEIYPRNGLAQARCKFLTSASKQVLFAGPDLIDGQWHTIVCHKDASQISLTVDGVTYSRAVALGALKTGSALYVGVGADGTDHYRGALDDVSIEIG